MASRGFAAWCGLAAIVSCTGCHPPSAENGAALFRKNCIACHSLLPGHAQHGPSLGGYFERSSRPTIAQARKAILGGGPFMPPFLGRLSPNDVDDLIVYMKTLR